MSKAKITWFVQDEEEQFMAAKSYTTEGAYTPGDYLIKNFQIWNNYNGKEDVDNINDAALVISFKNYEDNFLLNLLEVSVENGEYQKPIISIDRGYIKLGHISGNSNIGQSNSASCKNIKIKIGPIPENIKSDLKSIIFYIDRNNSYIIPSGSINIEDSNVTNNPNNNGISDADKDYFISNDTNILNKSINYTDTKVQEIFDKIVDNTPDELNTLKELAAALANNPNYASEELEIRQIIENKISFLEGLTNGFDTPIKEYIDSVNSGSQEDYTEEELIDLVNEIVNTINKNN